MSAEDSTIQQAELDRLIADFLERQDRGERVNEESMLREHPEHADGLRAFFGENARLHRVRSGFRDAESQSMEYRAGDQIGGRYKLLELIGEGGMGSVWLAQQLQPVKRKVAIKLIRAGMDSKVVLARFEAERQALALMEHPNIAQVFDGGVTERGRPYFVMEYIKGVPLTEYCDEARLSIRERMELMLPICRAVQHAHTRGIVHRDLKPSNIMVCLYDGHPVPKVIDFGLAKALHQNLTEQTLHTAHGAMVGTPIYMSPEQAELNNLDVDTRTDVYSLGVVLYELLTGTTPLDREFLQRAAMHEVLRLIREEEAVRPSTRLSGSERLPTIAAQRKMDPAVLRNVLSGDLDWIVLKALEKERARRYESTASFARDIERYLTDEAIEARPPGLMYRFGKMLRRNRVRSLVAGVLSAGLLIAGGGVIWGWKASRHAADRVKMTRVQVEEERKAKASAEASLAIQQKAADTNLAAGILRSIGLTEHVDQDDYSPFLSEEEFAALNAWGTISEDTARVAVLEQGLGEATTAMQIGRRFDSVLQACVGLSPSRRQLVRELLSEKQRCSECPAEVRAISCLLMVCLGGADVYSVFDVAAVLPRNSAIRYTFERRLWKLLPRLAEADRDRALEYLLAEPQQSQSAAWGLLNENSQILEAAVAPVSEKLWKRLIAYARRAAEEAAGQSNPEPKSFDHFELLTPVISTLPAHAMRGALDDLLDLFAEQPATTLNLIMGFRGGEEQRLLVQRLGEADRRQVADRILKIVGGDPDPERSRLLSPMLSALLPMLSEGDRNKYQGEVFELLRRAAMANDTSLWFLAEWLAACVVSPSSDDAGRFLSDLSAIRMPEQSAMLVYASSALMKMIPQMSADQLQECWRLFSSAAVRAENQNDWWMSVMARPFWLLSKHLPPAVAAEVCREMAGMPGVTGRPLTSLTAVVGALAVCGDALTPEQAVVLRDCLIGELESVDDAVIQKVWRENAVTVSQLLQVVVERSGPAEDVAVVRRLLGLLDHDESFGDAAVVISPAITSLLSRGEQPLIIESWQRVLAAVRRRDWRGADSSSLFDASRTAAVLLGSVSGQLVGNDGEAAWRELLQLLGPADAPPESGVITDSLTPVLIGPALRVLASQASSQEAVGRFKTLFGAIPYHPDFSNQDLNMPHSGMFLGAAEVLAEKLSPEVARELGNWLIADGQRSAGGTQNLAWQVVIPRLAAEDVPGFWDVLYQRAKSPEVARMGAIPQSLLSARLSPTDAVLRWRRIRSDLDGAEESVTTARICEFIPGLIDRVEPADQERMVEPLLQLLQHREDSRDRRLFDSDDRLFIAAVVSVAVRCSEETRMEMADSVLQALFAVPVEHHGMFSDQLTLVCSSPTQLAGYLGRPDCQSSLRGMLLKRFEELVLFDGDPYWHFSDTQVLLSADPAELSLAADEVETPDEEIERRRREAGDLEVEPVRPVSQVNIPKRQIKTLFDVAEWLEKSRP